MGACASLISSNNSARRRLAPHRPGSLGRGRMRISLRGTASQGYWSRLVWAVSVCARTTSRRSRCCLPGCPQLHSGLWPNLHGTFLPHTRREQISCSVLPSGRARSNRIEWLHGQHFVMQDSTMHKSLSVHQCRRSALMYVILTGLGLARGVRGPKSVPARRLLAQHCSHALLLCNAEVMLLLEAGAHCAVNSTALCLRWHVVPDSHAGPSNSHGLRAGH